ncbi:MAG: hypothetical protein WBP64_07715 [Nitrososphaeraceae archaeon]
MYTILNTYKIATEVVFSPGKSLTNALNILVLKNLHMVGACRLVQTYQVSIGEEEKNKIMTIEQEIMD